MKNLVMFGCSCALSISATVALAQSGTVRGDYVGCVTKSALSEFISAANANDNRQMQALIGTQCVNMNGLEYSVISRGLVNAEVRVYNDGNSVKLFTVSEAVR